MSCKNNTCKNRIVLHFFMIALAGTAILYILLFSRLDTISRVVSFFALGCLGTAAFLMFYTCRRAISFFNLLLNKINSIDNETFDRTPEDPEEILYTLDKMKNSWRATQLEKQLLADITQLIYSFSSLEELVDAITTRFTNHFGADFGYFLLDDKQGHLILKSTSGIKRGDMKKTEWAYGEGLSGAAAAGKKPLLYSDVEKEPGYIETIPGTRSLLIVPLITGDSVAGVMVLGSYTKGKFKDGDMDLMGAVSGEIGLAVANARLSGEIQDKVQELSTLYEATKAISSTVELDRVLQTTVKYIAGISGAANCSLELFGESREEWYTRETTGRRGDPPVPGTVLSVPLVSRDTVMGVINIDTPGPLSQDRRELVETLASRAAVAIENALLYRDMKELATRDGLTGLYNHRYFRERLEQEILRAQRHGHFLALVMMDIDDFKLYNDQYGHPTGDALLQELARLLSKQIRASDVVARYGGEEFVIILPETDSERAYLLVERLREAINKHNFGHGMEDGPGDSGDNTIAGENSPASEEASAGNKTLADRVKRLLGSLNINGKQYRHPVSHITISAGICSYPDRAGTMDELVSRADQALLKVKEKGKNMVLIYPE